MSRVLVTNDDGVDSVGLHCLGALAHELGHEVVVAAPWSESSGASASLTALKQVGQIASEQRVVPALADVPVFAVQATPAMIVLVAAAGAFGEVPEVVLSGVNRGANTGRAVLHSGTVGAALTAVSHGMRAMAVSLASATPKHWDGAVEAARRAFPLLDDQARAIVNVNAPDVPAEQIRGPRAARLATFGVVQTTVLETGSGLIRLAVKDEDAENEEGTDAALLAAGWATVTLVDPFCESLPGAVGARRDPP
jgi:5'-nucleotidase